MHQRDGLPSRRGAPRWRPPEGLGDRFWPADRRWFAATVDRLVSRDLLLRRFRPDLPSARTRISRPAAVIALINKLVRSPALQRWSDAALGRGARRVAARSKSPILAYSYYATHAFRPGPGQPRNRILFQVHPHPSAVRRLLQDEACHCPQGAQSLRLEHELYLEGEPLRLLTEEALLANGWITASTFTARTLIDEGVSSDAIRVVPYGVDSALFRQGPRQVTGPLVVTFVGSLTQRKGLSYLLEAAGDFPRGQSGCSLSDVGWSIGPCLQPIEMFPLTSTWPLASSAWSSSCRTATCWSCPHSPKGSGRCCLRP